MNEYHGVGTQIEEEHVRRFVQEHSNEGKSTGVMVAALRFRFNTCEKRGFDFKRLVKDSSSKKDHRCLSEEELENLDKVSIQYPQYRVGWHLMYDLACRVQDLLHFRYNSFKADSSGGGTYKWVAKKTQVDRLGYVSAKTMKLIEELR